MQQLLTDDWKDLLKINIYGFGRIARDNIDYFIEHFEVVSIVDSDKEKYGSTYRDIPIVHVDDAELMLKEHKTIIMTAERNAKDIANVLEIRGFIKNKDFCSMEHFVTEWYWRFQRKVCLLEVHMSVTTRCTLKCRNCNMFMPYYKEQFDYSVEDIERDLDLLFLHVDYLFKLELLGGEPLLNKELAVIIEKIAIKYKEQIGKIGIITNGTLLPDEKLLDVSKKYNISYSISDYTSEVPYKERMKEFVGLLQANGISYQLTKNFRWCDFGFPICNHHVGKENIREHMLSCGPVFHGLNDGKLYYCHVVWSAQKAGLWNEAEQDCVELERLNMDSDESKLKILRHCRGDMDGQFVSLCAVCGGCGNDNENYVKAAVQI